MRSFRELLEEAKSPFDIIDSACKQAGMKKWDGGWVDAHENKMSLQDAFHLIEKLGFKPIKGKQNVKMMGSIFWSFYFPKAGPYATTVVSIDSTNSEYVRTFHIKSSVDKS